MNCKSCMYHIETAPKENRCVWFIKRFVAAKLIPAEVIDIGCKHWRAKNGLRLEGYGEWTKALLAAALGQSPSQPAGPQSPVFGQRQ